jgi:mono/diheme cytochrome c family protein
MTRSTRALRTALLLAVCLIAAVVSIAAQQTKVTSAPAPVTSAASGAEMFKSYCAACHGTGGKGDGPAASAHKVPPPDLTMLAKKNGGKFPDMKIHTILRNGSSAPAHGSADMPVWGPVFSAVSENKPQIVELRIANLTDYIQSLQAK